MASTPVMKVADYLFAYANITYDNTVVLSTAFNAAIPTRLGDASATDMSSNEITSSGYSAWRQIAELEGPGGINAFRCTNNSRRTMPEQLQDRKWKAPPGASLAFSFYCSEPQTILLASDPHDRVIVEIEIPASDE